MRAWTDGFVGRHQVKPVMARGKDAGIFVRLIKSQGVEEVGGDRRPAQRGDPVSAGRLILAHVLPPGSKIGASPGRAWS